MNATMFVSTFLNGLTVASYLFVLAIGLNLSFGMLRIVNMSHGTFYLLGGYVGCVIADATKNWWLGFLGAGVIIGVVALLEEVLFLRRARGNSNVETLITLSVSVIGADVMIWIWGGYPRSISVPDLFKGQFRFGNISFPKYNLAIILFAIIVGIVFWLVLKRTKIGMIIRAGVDNFEITSTIGINIKWLFSLVFAVAGVMAGLAGVVGGTFQMVSPGNDGTILVYTLLIVIVGGMGSFEGAILASLIIGLIYTFGSILAPQFALFFMFAPAALILVFRPQGLCGRRR